MGGGAPKAEQQQQQQSWENLNKLFGVAKDLFGTTTGTAAKFGEAGKADLDSVRNYFKSLLSGGRTETAAAVAPAANALRASSDAAKKERADTGTGRTGGTVAANQQTEDQVRSAIDSLIGGVKPAAAQSLAGISEAEIAAMMNALGLGAESIGLGTGAAGTSGSLIGSDINSRRQASAAMWGSLIGGAADIASAGILK